MLSGKLVAERFEVEAVVGGGGMGMVFAAHDRVTGRRVALKLVGERIEARERFLQEGRMLSDLAHPGIVRYVAHGITATGELYLAMEWLEGETLAQRLRAGALALSDTIALGRRVTEALAHAHTCGIIHRDIKPSNILLVGGAADGARLLDFGVARFVRAAPRTQNGAVIGTPGYMSPEQAAGQLEIDARADLYGLGCVLYECVTGRAPFAAATPAALFAEIAFAAAPRVRDSWPDAPAWFDELVAALLAKRPEDRPASAAEVLQLLLRDGETGPTQELAPPVGSRLTQREQRLASIMLATPVDDDDAEALAAVASRFGARSSRLPDGSFVATLTGFAIATDLVAQAARCALAARAARPRVPLAVATGRSVLGARFPVGEAIERAAALVVREATAGVRVDEISAGLLDARFELAGDDVGLAVVGEREPFEPVRKLLGRATPCVGRDRELAQLDSLLAEVIEEPLAQAVLVTGQPGVGKSRLRHEFLRRAKDQGAEIWLARGDSMRAGSPYGLCADLVRHAAGLRDGEAPAVAERRLRARLGRHLAPDDARRAAAFLGEVVGLSVPDDRDPRLGPARQNPAIMGDQIQRAWEDLLAAETRAAPLILVVEDLHWGDVPSVRLLDGALRVLEESPLLVLALARPDIHVLFPHLWAGRRTHELRLAELRRKAGERLISAVLGDDVPEETVANLVSLSGGNVFHLEELIRAVAEGKGELPQTVLAMAHARLESLEPEARHLLRAASIYGETFWPGGVRALVGDELRVEDWLDDLTRREVVTPRAGASRFAHESEFSFRHALMREAAEAALTEADRELGHRLAAAWLERMGESDPMVLAGHWERAGEPRAAVPFYLTAAESALRGNDLTAAVARAERGVACGASGETLGALHLLRAEAQRWRGGDFASALAFGNEAVAHLPRGHARWYLAVGELATCAGLVGAHERLVEIAAELRAVAREVSAPLLVAGARAAVQLFHAGRFAMGAELVDWLEARAAELAAPDPSVDGWLGRARSIQASKVGDWQVTLAACARSAEELDAAGDVRTAVLQRMNLGDAQTNLGVFAEAERTLRHALAQSERLGLSHVIAPCKEMLAKARAGQGALAEAIELGLEAAALFREQGDRRMQALTSSEVASYLGRLGRDAEALEAARAAVDVAPSGSTRAACLTVVAELLLPGSPEEAYRAAAEGMELLERYHGIDERETWLRLVWARALLARGDREGAARAAAEARDGLLARMDKVRDPALRQAALARVAENAGTLALADELCRGG